MQATKAPDHYTGIGIRYYIALPPERVYLSGRHGYIYTLGLDFVPDIPGNKRPLDSSKRLIYAGLEVSDVIVMAIFASALDFSMRRMTNDAVVFTCAGRILMRRSS